MKKLSYIVAAFFISSSVFGEDALNEVFLDLNYGEKQEYKNFTPDIKDMTIKEDEEKEDYIYNPMKYIKDEAKELFFKKNSDE